MKGILFVIGALLSTQSLFADVTEFFNCKEIPASEVPHKHSMSAGELLVKTEDNFKHFEMKFTYGDEMQLFSQAYSCVFRDGAEKDLQNALAMYSGLGTEKVTNILTHPMGSKIKASNLPKLPGQIKSISQEVERLSGEDPNTYTQRMEAMIRRPNFTKTTAVKILLMSTYNNNSITLYFQ